MRSLANDVELNRRERLLTELLRSSAGGAAVTELDPGVRGVRLDDVGQDASSSAVRDGTPTNIERRRRRSRVVESSTLPPALLS